MQELQLQETQRPARRSDQRERRDAAKRDAWRRVDIVYIICLECLRVQERALLIAVLWAVGASLSS